MAKFTNLYPVPVAAAVAADALTQFDCIGLRHPDVYRSAIQMSNL